MHISGLRHVTVDAVELMTRYGDGKLMLNAKSAKQICQHFLQYGNRQQKTKQDEITMKHSDA